MSEGRSSDWEQKLAVDVHHRIAPMLRCILSIPTEMQSISENDFECFASTGVNMLAFGKSGVGGKDSPNQGPLAGAAELVKAILDKQGH